MCSHLTCSTLMLGSSEFIISLPTAPLASACSLKWWRADCDQHCSGKYWLCWRRGRSCMSLPGGAQPSDFKLDKTHSAHKMTEWNSSSLSPPMLSWIPEQAGRAREWGPCQSAALGSPGTPHTFAIFGQKISLTQTQLCSNYTFLFWEQADIHGLQPWGLCCQLWGGRGNIHRASSLPFLLLISSHLFQ